MIKKDIAELEERKGKGKDKGENILRILENLESVFTGAYFHYDNAFKPESEPKFEESVAERTKLKRQESAEQNEPGSGLKTLTPDQMLNRLPFSLAQLHAGNNSEKLKNEIRQLLCSLYRSKKLTKEIYKSLIDII